MLDVHRFAQQESTHIVKIVDITSLPLNKNRGYPTAILLMKPLPKGYIAQLNRENETDHTVFADYEHKTDELADKLAAAIQKEGYHAISQSENGIGSRGEYDAETKTTLLPQKTIAVLSGLGWIGKNNLFVTEKYGAALCMCSVLTDMPLDAERPEIAVSGCGECNRCVRICPAQVLHNRKWEPGINRDSIVDIYHCVACLKCLAGCRYSMLYAKKQI